MSQPQQPLFSNSFLQEIWHSEFQVYLTKQDAKVLKALQTWAEKSKQSETSTSAAFIQTFYHALWGYELSGTQKEGQPSTAYPEYAVEGAGAQKNTGQADLALGYFLPKATQAENLAQVLCEFKTKGANLDAPQKRANDNRTPVEQGCDYLKYEFDKASAAATVKPGWVIVTDTNEFRLYWRKSLPALSQRFYITAPKNTQCLTLLDEGEEAQLQRFLFWKMFQKDVLITKTGKATLEALLEKQWVHEKDIQEGFYKEYQKLRERLFNLILENNHNYEERKGKLVGFTQRLLDRFIFLFFCEDMGHALNFPHQLFANFIKKRSVEDEFDPNGFELWEKMKLLFLAMDKGGTWGKHTIPKFNGGLFKETKRLENLKVPNSIFCAAEQGVDEASLNKDKATLLYLAAHYNFGLNGTDNKKNISPYTMGRIFEQSITELEYMEAKADGRPSITELSKRKRDGVYYTPEWIVRFIVNSSLGQKILELRKEHKLSSLLPFSDEDFKMYQHTKRQGARVHKLSKEDQKIRKKIIAYLPNLLEYKESIGKIKVLDPACGSGAFLIIAFETLLVERRAISHAIAEIEGQIDVENYESLIKQILVDNIYGVDLNSESVEITKLALWLHTATANSPLCKLDKNILCGNSLISPEHLEGGEKDTEEETEQINPFDWNTSFPTIMEKGGFDVILGNPPYVRQELLGKRMKELFEVNYKKVHAGTADLYVFFLYKGFQLLNDKGVIAYIFPNKWMKAGYGKKMRAWLKGVNIRSLVDFGDLPIFTDVTTYPCVLTLDKMDVTPSFAACEVKTLEGGNPGEYVADNSIEVEQKNLHEEGWSLSGKKTADLLARLTEEGQPLGEYVEGRIYRGVTTGCNEAFIISSATRDMLIQNDPKAGMLIKPYPVGREIKRYKSVTPQKFLIFTRRGIDLEKYPSIKNYLEKFREKLTPKPKNFNGKIWPGRKTGNYQWFEIQDSTEYYKAFESKKIIYSEIASRGQFTFDDSGAFADATTYIIATNEQFLLGIFNSKLWHFLFLQVSPMIQGGFLRWKRQYMAPLPIPKKIPQSDKDLLSSLVAEQMIATKSLNEYNSNFLELLQTETELAKISKKMQDWHLLDFKSFKAELKKQKVELSLDQSAEWQSQLKKQQTSYQDLVSEVQRLDQEIDQAVYQLYSLTDSEIQLVEFHFNQ